MPQKAVQSRKIGCDCTAFILFLMVYVLYGSFIGSCYLNDDRLKAVVLKSV